MERIVAIAQQKGGCGKTTLATHLAWAFAASGRRVLLIDLDPQGHARSWLAGSPSRGEPAPVALAEVLEHSPLAGGGTTIERAVVSIADGLEVVGGELSLARLEHHLVARPGGIECLAEHLADAARRWEVVIIDTPPALGLLTSSAVIAAGEVLVPLSPDPYAFQGAHRLMTTVEHLERETGHRSRRYLVPTLLRRGERLTGEWLARARAQWGCRLLPLGLRRSVLFDRAAARGRVLAQTAPQAPAGRDVQALADHLLERWDRPGEACPR
ncbi:MAG TPA: ParA family protein [Acidobacteria bacterium]|nr:ParA family protein [Acidobacteriota bacterium]